MIESKNIWLQGFDKVKGDPIAMGSFFIVGLYGLAVILSALGIIAQDFALTHNNQTYASPSFDFLLGTDFLGRNVLSRVIQGARVAFMVGFFASSLSTLIGLSLGMLAGYFGGIIDDLVVWAYSTLDSIPYILLISAFTFSLGQGVTNLYIALGLTGWVRLCRLARGEIRKHKELDYITAAKAIGGGHWQRLTTHLLPNIAHLAFVQFSLSFVAAIKIEVILSYLGLGVEPGTPSWGLMINDAPSDLARGVWWTFVSAAILMFILILAINLFTDALRNAIDPKLKLK